MAVKYKELKKKIEEIPLNERELEVIKLIEAYIDSKLIEKFDNGPVSFGENLLRFKYNPANPHQVSWEVFKDIKDTRKEIMTKELIERYDDAGWNIEYEYGEDDGPNRPAMDYWVFKGKK